MKRTLIKESEKILKLCIERTFVVIVYYFVIPFASWVSELIYLASLKC